MGAFNDTTCPKCKARFGFLKECPPCPKCGHQIDPKEFEADEAEMKAFEQLLLERRKKKDGN